MAIVRATSAVQTIFLLQNIKQLRDDKVAKVGQSIVQLGTIDRAGFIVIVAGEGALPNLECIVRCAGCGLRRENGAHL